MANKNPLILKSGVISEISSDVLNAPHGVNVPTGKTYDVNGSPHTHAGVSTTWGNITGTLSGQTDLNSSLSGKSDISHNHSGTYEPAFTNLAYSKLPTGGGTWATGGNLSITGGNLGIKSATGQNLILLREGSDAYGSNIRIDSATGDTCFDRVVNNVASESVRVQRSNGNVGIGTTSPASYHSTGNQLVVKAAGAHSGITIATDSSSYCGNIYFARGIVDGVTNNAYQGSISYIHSSDTMQFCTAANGRMSITGNGNVGIGGSLYVDTGALVVSANHAYIEGDASNSFLFMSNKYLIAAVKTSHMNFGSAVGYQFWCTKPDSATYSGTMGYSIDGAGNTWCAGQCSALSFSDRTPYPETTSIAYDAVKSLERLPVGRYKKNDKKMQVNHDKCHDFIKGKDSNSRDLSALVSCQNEVIKDLIKRIVQLEAK